MKPLNRRHFLTTTAKGAGLATLFAGLPKGWVGSAYADDAPETADVKFGIVALMPYFLKKPFSWPMTMEEQSVSAMMPNFTSAVSGASSA